MLTCVSGVYLQLVCFRAAPGPLLHTLPLASCVREQVPRLLGIFTVSCLEDAVKTAYKTAESGDVITLSPACAAFDQFKNFMVRGEFFKKIVKEL